MPPAVEVRSLNYRTTREVPKHLFFLHQILIECLLLARHFCRVWGYSSMRMDSDPVLALPWVGAKC